MAFPSTQQVLYTQQGLYMTQSAALLSGFMQTQTAPYNAQTGLGMTQVQVWAQWIQWMPVTDTTTSAINVWNTWANATTTNSVGYAQGLAQRTYTPEEVAAREQRQLDAGLIAAEAVERRAKAETKAKSLMRDNLTPMQREALEKHGWFLVEGGKSKKLYRVHARGYAGNIYELDDKMKEVVRLCVHAPSDIPLGDQLLAQALSLRFDEDHIIAKANRTAMAA